MHEPSERRALMCLAVVGLSAAVVFGACGGGGGGGDGGMDGINGGMDGFNGGRDGCNGREDGGSKLPDCDQVQSGFSPCGGDPIGGWELVQNCPAVLYGDAPPSLEPDCPTATVQAVMEFRGTLDVDATTVQWLTTTFSYEEDVTVPASCVSDAWAGDCANVEAVLESSRPGVACTAEADGSCTCSYEEYELDDTHEAYNYEIMNGNELQYGTGPNDGPKPFCVQGDEMTWQENATLFGTQYMRFERR